MLTCIAISKYKLNGNIKNMNVNRNVINNMSIIEDLIINIFWNIIKIVV